VPSSINILRQLDYSELLFIDESILQSFMYLLDSINGKAISLETIVESFDLMIKRWGQIFCRELALKFSHLHSYVLKLLTQTQSPKFGESCYGFGFMLSVSHLS